MDEMAFGNVLSIIQQNFLKTVKLYSGPLTEMVEGQAFGQFLRNSLRDNLASAVHLYFSPLRPVVDWFKQAYGTAHEFKFPSEI
jgi:hypothetical protein